jgi:hypothetical protein
MNGFEMEDFVPFFLAGVTGNREPSDAHIKLTLSGL